MRTLLIVLSFVASTTAFPINLTQTRNGSTCLAVLLTLFLLLSFLIVFKQIFMKNRRSQSQFTPACSFTYNSSTRSSASILPSNASIRSSGGGKTGFFVGLFGSPSWETRTKTATEDKSEWGDRKMSFMYQLHSSSGSRRVKYSQARMSSSNEKGSVIHVAQSRSLSMSRSTIGDIRTLYEHRDATGLGQRKSRSLRIPARPSKAYMGSPHTWTPRRFSLPAIGRKESQNMFLLRKSASSFKSTRSRRSDASGSSSLANSSLRLVDTKDGPDYPLPLSPNHERASAFNGPEKVTPLQSNLGPKRRSFVAPPLPTLPVLSSHMQGPGPDVPSNDTLKSSSAILRISHPYALAPNNHASPESNTPSRNQGFHSKVLQVTSNYIRPPHPVLASKADCQSPVIREPLAQVTSSINYSPLVFPFSSTGPSLSSGYSPYSPLNPLTSPKAKHKTNSPSFRARRSPAIGPSPLRSMILPDLSGTNIATPPISKDSVGPMKDSSSCQRNHYTRLGLGFPSASYTGPLLSKDDLDNVQDSTTEVDREKDNRRHSSPSGQVEDEDPNILLGIIQELVEETSEWDASLFMDQKFKAMIQASAGRFSNSQLDREASFDSKSVPNALSVDRSEGVDLRLLGIETFRSDGETFIPPTKDIRANGNREELVSFWDERGWANPGDKWYDLLFHHRLATYSTLVIMSALLGSASIAQTPTCFTAFHPVFKSHLLR
jgi:hypothetical protein